MPRALHENSSSSVPKIKLCTIEIPKLGGQITDFKDFHDTFSSSIINNQASEMSLLSSVTSEAHQLIQNLPVTQQNFHVAWN